MFEKDSACRELGVVAFGFGEPHPVPSAFRHFGGSTERPDVALLNPAAEAQAAPSLPTKPT